MNVTLRLCILIVVLSMGCSTTPERKAEKLRNRAERLARGQVQTFPYINRAQCERRERPHVNATIIWPSIPSIQQYCQACRDTKYCGDR